MAFRIPLRSSPLTGRLLVQRLHGAQTRHQHSKPPPLPTIPTCPPPTCECAATPAMPEGLPIDHQGRLNGLISSYAEQVLVCTGKDDWPSRIEDDCGGDNLAADLKELVGRGGDYSDPFHNISVLNASFPPTPFPGGPAGVVSASAYLLPSFRYVPILPRVSFAAAEALVRGCLLPERLHPAHDGLSPVHRDRLTRVPALARQLLPGARAVDDVLVLACGHGGRDARCGVMGPALRDEFEARLPPEGAEVLRGPAPMGLDGGDGGGRPPPAVAGPAGRTPAFTARVGLISHIGGHKFAGNVIVYLPPSMKARDGERHPLAGHGIWYGRVEPKHVQGIVEETIMKGNVIADMFRGGITPDREILRG